MRPYKENNALAGFCHDGTTTMEYFSINLKENYRALIILNKEARRRALDWESSDFWEWVSPLVWWSLLFPLRSTGSRGKNAQLKKATKSPSVNKNNINNTTWRSRFTSFIIYGVTERSLTSLKSLMILACPKEFGLPVVSYWINLYADDTWVTVGRMWFALISL